METSSPSHLTQLFAAEKALQAPGRAWNPKDFSAVDDRVRGGSSTSHVHLSQDDQTQGELIFSGFLDITTLGGAGFASQQFKSSPPFPVHLSQHDHRGLQIRLRPDSTQPSSSATLLSTNPGGGKGPVTSYVLNLYPTLPVKRPDGRNESSITYEHTFRLGAQGTQQPERGDDARLLSFDLPWSEFKPFYRGRPADQAGPLDPSQVKLWSIMARSDFGAQSGPFSLQVNSLWAIANDTSSLNSFGSKSDGLTLKGDESLSQWEKRWQPADMKGSAGFALYLFASLALLLWVIWALTPDRILRAAGIDWYPNREWAFIIPSFSLVLVLFAYIAYLALNIHMTPDLNDLKTVTDTHATPLPIKRASDFPTFEEAQRYHDHKHPMREKHIDSEERKRLLKREIYDLPIWDGTRG